MEEQEVVNEQVENDEVDATATEEENEHPGEETADASDKPARGVQKRIDELTKRSYEEREENQRLQQRLADLENPQRTEAQHNAEPQVEDYADYADYTKAVGRWAAKEERLQADHERAVRSSQDTVKRKAEGVVAVGREKFEDFDEVALSANVRVSDTMANAIGESEAGPEVAYYLGKNLDEARRISALAPIKQVMEIARIEARFTTTPGRKTTGAPTPVTTVGRGNSATSVDPDKMSTAEWMRHRNKTAKV